MGWTYLSRKPNDIKQFLTDELNTGDPTSQYFRQVLEVRIVNIRTAYVAAHQKTPNFDGVVAFVILLDYPRSKKCTADKFGYKIMEETMGPAMSECPESILKLLSDLPDTDAYRYARTWRERCHSHAKLIKDRAIKRKPGTSLIRPYDGLKATVISMDGQPYGAAVKTSEGNLFAVGNQILDQFEVAP